MDGDDFASRSLEAAGVGGWDFDCVTRVLRWNPGTFYIHDIEVGPTPSLEAALAFYTPASRLIIDEAVRRAVTLGSSYDLELQLVTAKGRHIWVNSRGFSYQENGRTVRLTGSMQDVTARHDLSERAERLALVVRQMTNAVVITDCAGNTEWVNEAFCSRTGYSLDEAHGRWPGTLLHGPETDAATSAHIRERIAAGEGFSVEILSYAKSGEKYWMAITCTKLLDADGMPCGFIAVENDITMRRQAEEALRHEAHERRKAESLLRDVLDTLPVAVIAYDSEERLLLTNQAYGAMFPLGVGFAAQGVKLPALIRNLAENGEYLDRGASVVEREKWIDNTIASHRDAATPRTVQLANGRFIEAREKRSATGNLVGVRTDITDLTRAEADLRRQVDHDSLTGLANRASLLRVLKDTLERSDRRPVNSSPTSGSRANKPGPMGPSCGTLLMFDIDHFKQINDTLGHDIGDLLLIEIAVRIRKLVRPGDIAARLGGDEFAVLMLGMSDGDAAKERLSTIHAALMAPALLGGHSIRVTVSAGATFFPDDGIDPATLIKNADLALYEAKRGGRARWCAFRIEQAQELEHHFRLAAALGVAIADGHITVALQPKRTIMGQHAGFEALARWHDGERFVPPNEFIPVAEDTGLIVPLGTVVLEAALLRISQLKSMGLEPGRVAVNVASAQLLDVDFFQVIKRAIRRYGLQPSDLEFEVTETVLLGAAAVRIEDVLRDLRSFGITLALDDFGTGFASLAHLSRLPIDRLKIDRSFVKEIGSGGRGGIIARTIVGLAASLGMDCVAEGVETQEQFEFLCAERCGIFQGYLFSRPLGTLDEAAKYLERETAPNGRDGASPVDSNQSTSLAEKPAMHRSEPISELQHPGVPMPSGARESSDQMGSCVG